MKVLKGNNLIDISEGEFKDLIGGFDKVAIDLGCGDGRFVYKSAEQDETTFFIGVDPAIKQAGEFSKKANRNKVKNLLYVVGSYELFPNELIGLADILFVILPWGSLLKAVAQPAVADVNKLATIIKPKGQIKILFGYDPHLEPSQTTRLDLQDLDEHYIQNSVIKIFQNVGFKIDEFKRVETSELKTLHSTWSKKISSKAHRPIFIIFMTLKD